MPLQLNVVGPKFADAVLAGVEIQPAVSSFFEVHQDVQVTISIPIVVVETVWTVVLRVRLNHVDAPATRTRDSDMLFPGNKVSLVLLLTQQRPCPKDGSDNETQCRLHGLGKLLLRANAVSSNLNRKKERR